MRLARTPTLTTKGPCSFPALTFRGGGWGAGSMPTETKQQSLLQMLEVKCRDPHPDLEAKAC